MGLLWWIILLVGVVIGVLLLCSYLLRASPKAITNFQKKHVVITGGSTGLGKALAAKFLQEGSNVTILARTISTLEKAREELLKQRISNDQKVFSLGCDVTNFEQLKKTAETVVQEMGVPDVLIPNAGSCIPGYFLNQSVEVMEQQMKLNYFGTVYTIKAFLPSMVERGKGGHITLISSTAAFVGCIGFASYMPTKLALKGLSDCLRNELLLYDIGVSSFYPGSIDTEGFVEENKIKPQETKLIEGKTTLNSPQKCAEILVDGMKKGQYLISSTFFPDTLTRILGHGLTFRDSPLMDFLMAPLLVLYTNLGVYTDLDSVVLKSRKESKKKN